MTIEEYASVWDAIEDDPVKSANLKIRSKLMMEVSNYVEQSGLTQVKAAEKLGVSQPRLNDVLKGKIEKCTVDRLVNMLSAVGFKVNLSVLQAA